jgi:DNA-binding response OmpR family regulator
MQAPRYETVTAALYDPVALNRNATRNVLYSLGFREIESFAALDDLKRAMATRDFDLVVLEATRAEDPIYDFVGKIRRSEIARNPFAVVMVSTWLPEAQLVKKVLDCGADDLMCRPFSTAMLGDRLRTHVHNRKGFVVTADYVGPDRRSDASRANSAKPIEVVNSMRLKAVEGKSGFEAQTAVHAGVQSGRRVINDERMRRLAFQIGVIAGFVHGQTSQEAEIVRRSDLEKIVQVAQDLTALAKSEQAEQAVKTCQTIIEVAQTSMSGEDLASNAQIMVRLSVALQVTLTPGTLADQFHAELDETLERIRARGRRA